jgi:hypothetical protein
MSKKPTIPDFPTLPDFGQMITQACEVVASVRGIPYDFNGALSLENKFVVLFKTVREMFNAQDELVKSYKDLYNFINTYFTNLDVQEEINSKLDNMSKTGELSELLKNFVKINQPILVNSKESMVDTSALYILASDGFVYYYNGSEFVASSMKYNAPINAYENHSYGKKFNINDIKNIGSYTVDPTSLTGLVLENVTDYYWACYCITPVVANNTDVLQYLIGLPLENTQNPPAFYYRYSLLGKFTTFNRSSGNSNNIKDYYTSHFRSTKYNIDDIKRIGSYTVDPTSLKGLVLENVTDYYWACYCITPVVANNTDVLQYLIGLPLENTQNPPAFYYRYSLLGKFTTFNRSSGNSHNIKDYYTSHFRSSKYNIDDIKRIGSYTVEPTSLTGLVLENVTDYYWSCYCITPVVDNNTDVLQYLIGLPLENTQNPPAFYYRYSLLGKFTTFHRTLRENKISKKVCFCGDSFTHVAPVKSYVSFLNEYGCCDGVNYGIPGSNPNTWLNKHENDITDGYDVYFIAFGLNGLNIPNGNFNDNTNDTYCGQMNILIDKIYSKCPTARIIIWCMDGWFPEERSNAFKQVADYKGCEFYSMKADKNIPVRLNGKFANVLPNLSPDIVNLKNKALKLSDDHPNEKAQKMLANYLMHII